MSSPDNDEEESEPPSNSIYDDVDEPQVDLGVLEASAELRRQEYESLKVIYKDDDIGFKEWDDRFGCRIRIGELRLEIVTGPRYPLIEAPLNITVSAPAVSESVQITDALMDLAESKRGSMMLFDLIEEARCLLRYIADGRPVAITVSINGERIKIPVSDLAIARCAELDAKPYMDGITLEMVARRLAEDNVTIIHTELVMNPRLIARFEAMRGYLRRRYPRDIIRKENFLATDLVFHGTRRKFIPNIISRGFVKPGDLINENGDRLQVRCGSTFGRGIYTSPEPRYSMSYSDTSDTSKGRIPGEKLIVCAVLMGRRVTVGPGNLRERQWPKKGYDSHVSTSGFEYIVFNSAQLLPLYVLHVTRGDPNLESYWNRRVARGPPVNLKEEFDPLAERKKTGVAEIDESETNLTLAMKRKILTKLGRKHFPLGFGPAIGDKFVVEEIGEVDDDEEEWGEYQLDRKGYFRVGEGVFTEFDDPEMEFLREKAVKGSTKFIKRDEFQRARYGGREDLEECDRARSKDQSSK